MLDLRYIVENREAVEKSLTKRGADKFRAALARVEELDRARRTVLQEVEQLKHRRNTASQQIAEIKKAKGDDKALMEEMKGVSQRIKALDEMLAGVDSRLKESLYELPNILDASVPAGETSEQNVEVKKWGTIRKLDFTPKTHDEIGEAMGIMNFKKAGEVTGARFVFLKGLAARLERALIQFMLDSHLAAGYEEIQPPFLVNRAALTGTGQLPKFEEDVFRIEKFDFFLIPTAEVPVTNYHREEVLEEKDLPRKYVAYTPCFRSEAGSYGRDTKGLKRQHQFNKVELVKFVRPENSLQELETLRADAEAILQKLELPYRVVTLCGGDTGFGSAKTYDIEVWSPASNSYMEISSCSTFSDYQARRSNIRFRSSTDKKLHFVHTLNGSGLAVGRTLLAIIENYQKADGTFEIPKALRPYLESRV